MWNSLHLDLIGHRSIDENDWRGLLTNTWISVTWFRWTHILVCCNLENLLLFVWLDFDDRDLRSRCHGILLYCLPGRMLKHSSPARHSTAPVAVEVRPPVNNDYPRIKFFGLFFGHSFRFPSIRIDAWWVLFSHLRLPSLRHIQISVQIIIWHNRRHFNRKLSKASDEMEFALNSPLRASNTLMVFW